MADRKISDLTALTTPASGDYLPIVDISEAAAASKNKRVTVQSLFQGIPVNVGIGTSSPAVPLDVSAASSSARIISTTGTNFAFLNFNNTAGNAYVGLENSAGGNFSIGTGAYSLCLAHQGAYPICFATNNIERLRIDSSGRLLVGTSSTLITSTVVLQGSNGATTSEAILRLCRGQDSPADGALLGDLSFGDSNNGDAARIFAQRDGGTWTSASSRPSRLVFSTAADGSATPTERLRIDSPGRLLIGTSASRGVGAPSPYFGSTQIETTGLVPLTVVNNSNDFQPAYFLIGKSRGSIGSNTIVQNGDGIGYIGFAGADGTDLETRAASISCEVDGTPGADDMPGRLVFSTTADGASSPTERLRIDSSGNVGIGTTAPTTLLDVNADTVRVRTARTPASATATGDAGEICWDASYIYVCTATNTWKRAALSTW